MLSGVARRLFERVGQLQYGEVLVAPADDLQTDRQSVVTEPTGN